MHIIRHQFILLYNSDLSVSVAIESPIVKLYCHPVNSNISDNAYLSYVDDFAFMNETVHRISKPKRILVFCNSTSDILSILLNASLWQYYYYYWTRIFNNVYLINLRLLVGDTQSGNGNGYSLLHRIHSSSRKMSDSTVLTKNGNSLLFSNRMLTRPCFYTPWILLTCLE
jgi:hypothetical protein